MNKRKIKNRIYSFSATLCSLVMVLTIILSVLKMGEEAWGAEIQSEISGKDIVERAIEYLGVPYHSYTDEEVNKYGIDQTKGFDCSNYVKTVCDSLGFRKDSSYTMPTGPWSWYVMENFMYKNVNYNIEVVDINDKSSWQPGDIMIFGTSARPWTHMAIYVGEYNNAASMISALGLSEEQAKYIVDYNTGCTSWRINCMGNPIMTDMGYPYCVRLDNGMDGKMGNGYVTKIIRLAARSTKEPTYGFIRFSKAGKNGEAAIPNVQWRIYASKDLAEKALNERGSSSDNVPYITSFTTNTEGYAELEIDNGIYYALEWKSKTGSSISDTIYEVNITDESKQFLTNDEWYVSLKIIKVDSVNSNKLLNGAEFTLYEYNVTSDSFIEAGKLKNTENGIYVIDTYKLTSDAAGNKKEITDGKLYYTELNRGQYKIVETKNPDGYTGDYTGYFSISEDNNGTVIEKKVENTPVSGKIVINKLNALDTEIPVKGALINIYADKECTKFLAQCETDQNGVGRFYYNEGIQISEEIFKWSEDKELIFNPGTYYAKEQDAPVNYFTNPNVFEVTVSYEESVVTILDNPKPGNIVLYKYDENNVTYDTSGNIVGGLFLKDAVYGIYTDEECRTLAKYVEYSDDLTKTIFTDKTAILTTKDDGSVSSGYLIPGNYYVKEITPPAGYLINDKVYPVEVVGNSFTNVFALDKAKELSLVIHKTDTVTGVNSQGDATFEGAQFAIYAEENIYSKESGDLMFIANKQIALYKKADGTYTFKTEDSQITEKATTDSSGSVTITGLVPGKYYITEKAAPEGYILNEDLKIHIDLSDSTYTSYKSHMSNPSEIAKEELLEEKTDGSYHVYFNDDILTGELIISKYDKTTEEPLIGAYFSLYLVKDILISNNIEKLDIDENNGVNIDGLDLKDMEIGLGEEIGYIGMTDDTGKLHIKNIPYGIYLVREVKAPAGYKIAKPKMVIIGPEKEKIELTNITELGIYKSDVFDELMPQSLTINKYVADFGLDVHPESPATFVLKDSTGNVIAQDTCDNNGNITFSNLYPGTYSLEETIVPEGYLKVYKDIKIVVIKTNDSYATIDGEHVKLKYVGDYNMLIDIPNSKNRLTIVKVDEKDNPLSGATLSLYMKGEDGNLTEISKWETDGNPKTFESIKNGIYVLREISAPSGYQIAADIEFEIKGEPKVITMKDLPKEDPPEDEVEPDEPTRPVPPPPEIEEEEFTYEPVQTGIGTMKIEFLVILLSGAGMIISFSLLIYNNRHTEEY